MRIGINASFFAKPATGIGTVTLDFLYGLRADPEQEKHEWFWYYEGAVPSGEWPSNWHFRRVNAWWSRDDLLHHFLFERFALPRAARRDHCEVFFSLYQSSTELAPEIRHVMLVHDLILKRFPEYLVTGRQRLYYRQVLRAISKAQALIVPSLSTAHDLEELLDVSEERISVIAPGIADRYREKLSAQALMETLTRYEIRPGYIYHGGGLEKRKNTEAVLAAYHALRTRRGESVPQLVISGMIHSERNPLATPVRSLLRAHQLEGHVKLLGWVPETDLPALYQGALMFVFPSRAEGFGLPMVEAFASGTPVLAGHAGALPEIAQDAALLVDPDNTEVLSERMERLLDDSELRKTLSSRGQNRAEEFRPKTFASKVRSLLVQ